MWWQYKYKTYLNDIGWFLNVLLEEEHGGGVAVDVELSEQALSLRQALVHISKADKVLVGKRRELWVKSRCQKGNQSLGHPGKVLNCSNLKTNSASLMFYFKKAMSSVVSTRNTQINTQQPGEGF